MSGSQTISSGVTSVIASGITADGDVILNGGTLDVAGGVASSTVVSRGGQEYADNGTVAFEIISAGGYELLSAHIHAQDDLVAGGTIVVASGAIATGTTIDVGLFDIAGGLASASVVQSGGTIDILLGTAFGDTLLGGTELLDGVSAVASASTIASGSFEYIADGTAVSATISTGGTQAFGYAIANGLIVSEGVASATTIVGGGVQLDNVSVFDDIVQSGGRVIVSGSIAIANASTITANGVELVEVGSAVSAVISVGGTQFVDDLIDSGVATIGVAVATTIATGGVQVDEGLAIGDVIASGGLVYNEGTTSRSMIRGGTEYLTGSPDGADGIARSATVASGVLSLGFGTASATTILNGGTIVVGGTAIGDVVSGGMELIGYHALVTSSFVAGGGFERVSAGSVSSSVLASGGSQLLEPGAAATDSEVRSGAQQTLMHGAIAFADTIAQGATVFNGGTLFFDGGSNATIAGQLVGSGLLLQSGAGTLVLAAAQPNFAGSVLLDTGVVEIEQPAHSVISSLQLAYGAGTLRFDGISDASIISGFVSGTTIDLAGLAFDTAATATLTGTNMLEITGGGAASGQVQLDRLQDFTGEYFHLAPDGGPGTDITVDSTPCYCAGTHLLTDRGEVAIEALQPGDLLVTRDGRQRAVVWIGRRSYAARFAARNRDVWPVQVRAGALGQGIPHRDLFVSPQHALFLDDVLVPAIALVNGTSIRQVRATKDLHYLHVELDSHDVILAEGAPAESFVDDDSRGMFHNAGSYDGPQRSPLRCAPFVEDGHLLDMIRNRLEAGRKASGLCSLDPRRASIHAPGKPRLR